MADTCGGPEDELQKQHLKCTCGAPAVHTLIGPKSYIGACEEHLADAMVRWEEKECTE